MDIKDEFAFDGFGVLGDGVAVGRCGVYEATIFVLGEL